MALYSLYCAGVLWRNCSLTHVWFNIIGRSRNAGWFALTEPTSTGFDDTSTLSDLLASNSSFRSLISPCMAAIISCRSAMSLCSFATVSRNGSCFFLVTVEEQVSQQVLLTKWAVSSQQYFTAQQQQAVDVDMAAMCPRLSHLFPWLSIMLRRSCLLSCRNGITFPERLDSQSCLIGFWVRVLRLGMPWSNGGVPDRAKTRIQRYLPDPAGSGAINSLWC